MGRNHHQRAENCVLANTDAIFVDNDFFDGFVFWHAYSIGVVLANFNEDFFGYADADAIDDSVTDIQLYVLNGRNI